MYEDIEGPVCTQKDDDGCADDPNLGRCPACSYLYHDEPRSTDDAHDELCCGTKPHTDRGLDYVCITHDRVGC
jgi:hypothetical protein